MVSVVPVVLKNVNPFSSKSFDSSEPKVLNRTFISDEDFFAAAKKQRIDVAGFSISGVLSVLQLSAGFSFFGDTRIGSFMASFSSPFSFVFL